jgi:hypothetical protein
MKMSLAIAAVVLLGTGAAHASNFPNLDSAEKSLGEAKAALVKAEEDHKDHGTLGGHGAEAVKHVEAAEAAVKAAIDFATQHPATKGHKPGQPHDKEKHHAAKDDHKYPNLGAARSHLEDAGFHVMEAMKVHASIGGLGDHGAQAEKAIRDAVQQVNQAEKFADEHYAAKPAEPAK